MELNVVDRVIILTNLLQRFGTSEQIRITKSIKEKLLLKEAESKLFELQTDGTGVTSGSFTAAAYSTVNNYELTEPEINHLYTLAKELDNKGMIEEATLDTIEKIYQEKE